MVYFTHVNGVRGVVSLGAHDVGVQHREPGCPRPSSLHCDRDAGHEPCSVASEVERLPAGNVLALQVLWGGE